MEKFAEKFHIHNPSIFASADVAYVLAFSVIMLNTDAHSNQIKHKMTKEGFLKNNKGINGDHDLDPEYLGGIYDRICENEIKMKDATDDAAAAGSGPVGAKNRQVNFRRESMALVKKTQQLMAVGAGGAAVAVGITLNAPGSTVTAAEASLQPAAVDSSVVASLAAPPPSGFYYAATDDITMITPMFQILWGPAHATFSVLLQLMDDPRLVALCLDGYRFAIRLAGLFRQGTEREAFVASLTQFTLLGQTQAKELKQKNIDAIKILLTIAYTEGDRLGACWLMVLKCISEFERLHLIGSGAMRDSAFFQDQQNKRRTAGNGDVDAAVQREAQQAGNAQV